MEQAVMELNKCTLLLAYLLHVQNSAFYLIDDINQDEGKSVWKSKDDRISESKTWKSGSLITQLRGTHQNLIFLHYSFTKNMEFSYYLLH